MGRFAKNFFITPNNDNPRSTSEGISTRMAAGGSTNLAAGTIDPQLSNCFLLEVHDDMEHIAKSVADVMLLSKASGGLGVRGKIATNIVKRIVICAPITHNFAVWCCPLIV